MLMDTNDKYTSRRELERQYRDQVRDLQDAVTRERDAARDQVSAVTREMQLYNDQLQQEENKLKSKIASLQSVSMVEIVIVLMLP